MLNAMCFQETTESLLFNAIDGSRLDVGVFASVSQMRLGVLQVVVKMLRRVSSSSLNGILELSDDRPGSSDSYCLVGCLECFLESLLAENVRNVSRKRDFDGPFLTLFYKVV